MKHSFISVIIPTLNEEKYIKKTLLSLRNQDYEGKYEIIVADSCSKDKTVDIAKKYADKVVLVKKMSPGAGRNAGAKEAKGNILLFIDADTIAIPNLLKVVEKTFKNEKVTAAIPPMLPLEYGKHLITFILANEFGLKLLIKLKNPILPTVCLACKKNIFLRTGGFNENLKCVEDLEFSSRLKKYGGKIIFMKDTFVLASLRRFKKWGFLKSVRAWPLGYLDLKLYNKTPKYDSIR